MSADRAVVSIMSWRLALQVVMKLAHPRHPLSEEMERKVGIVIGCSAFAFFVSSAVGLAAGCMRHM